MTHASPIPVRPDYGAARARAGQSIVRAAAAIVLARADSKPLKQVFAERWPGDKRIEEITRTATSPATEAGSSLTGIGVADFVGLLSSASASSTLMPLGMQLELGTGRGPLMVQAIAADPDNVAFVEEGKPGPVMQFSTAGGSILAPKKLMAFCVFTRELTEHSTPNVETLTRAQLSESISLATDSKMLDATIADATRPAGLRSTINASSASTSDVPETAMAEDVATLVAGVAGVAGNAPIVFVAAPAQAAKLRLWNRSNFNYPALASSGLAAKTVLCIASNALVTAVDPMPRFELSDTAELHFDDASPRDIDSTAVAATVKSLWQSDLIGLRVVMQIAWGLRGTGGLAWVENVLW